MSEFELQRLGLVMKPEPGNPLEAEGVLNPAAVRGPDSQLYLFPRLVARGNYSRIGIARVRFDEAGNPTGIERLGIALEPEADYEQRPNGGQVRDRPNRLSQRYGARAPQLAPQRHPVAPWLSRQPSQHHYPCAPLVSSIFVTTAKLHL